MKALSLAKRNFKEIVKDPLATIFSILLPVFLLFIFQQFDIPSEVYDIKNFAPSIIIFGFSFITLFTATLISKDKFSSLLSRLYASPLKEKDYVMGYTLSLIPLALFQSILFFIVSLLLGLKFNINIIITIIVLLPVSILFISFGILIGSLVNDKAAPGVGSVIVQLVAFTSGMYFSPDQLGGAIEIISKILPFSYCTTIARSSLSGNILNNGSDILIVMLYIIGIFIISSLVFKKKMISDNK